MSIRIPLTGAFRILLYMLSAPLLMVHPVDAQPTGKQPDIIPYPADLRLLPGKFAISTKTTLVRKTDRFGGEAAFLQSLIREYLGQEIGTAGQEKTDAIVLKYDPSIPSAEAYSIQITTDRITLTARNDAAMFYAIGTLRQLLPAGTGKYRTLLVPCLEISDKPAFPWRGMMLDVSRHFFSTSYLKKFADRMALYKLNKLHLHLTDDQGWRIEIKKYPRLTAEGAWRTFNNQDSACVQKAAVTGNTDFLPDEKHIVQRNGQTLYGGFYTQEEMRDFIAYATRLHIEVIPEIDMPGHLMAATRIYPELTCDSLVGSAVGVFSNPICPCKEEALTFAEDILTEVADLFPSSYIHIGGDEVNKKSWQDSPLAKDFMQRQGFTRVEEIQRYFNRRILTFLRSKGKTLVGWDELLEGGIDSSAIVMYWRGWVPEMPSVAAKNKNRVIMSPSGPLYFDAIPDALTLPTVYRYDPFDTALYHLDETSRKQVAGVQANVWTEMIPSEKRADYMVMPRLAALAELGWTHRYDYDSFVKRLNSHYARWDRMGIHYRFPDLTDLAENYAVIGQTTFFVSPPHPLFKIRYTVNGAAPDAASPVMQKPIVLTKTLDMNLALFDETGRRGDVYTLHFRKQSLEKSHTVADLKEGLRTTLHKGYFRLTSAIKEQADSVFTAADIRVPATVKEPAFGLKFSGYIQVPQTGIYTFYLTCNDGGTLSIDNRQIVNNDGLHPDRTIGGQAGLEKGLHLVAVNFMDYGGGYRLELSYSFNGHKPEPVPASWFKSAGYSPQ